MRISLFVFSFFSIISGSTFAQAPLVPFYPYEITRVDRGSTGTVDVGIVHHGITNDGTDLFTHNVVSLPPSEFVGEALGPLLDSGSSSSIGAKITGSRLNWNSLTNSFESASNIDSFGGAGRCYRVGTGTPDWPSAGMTAPEFPTSMGECFSAFIQLLSNCTGHSICTNYQNGTGAITSYNIVTDFCPPPISATCRKFYWRWNDSGGIRFSWETADLEFPNEFPDESDLPDSIGDEEATNCIIIANAQTALTAGCPVNDPPVLNQPERGEVMTDPGTGRPRETTSITNTTTTINNNFDGSAGSVNGSFQPISTGSGTGFDAEDLGFVTGDGDGDGDGLSCDLPENQNALACLQLDLDEIDQVTTGIQGLQSEYFGDLQDIADGTTEFGDMIGLPGAGSAGTCFTIPPVDAFGAEIELDTQFLCEITETFIRPFLTILATLTAVGIIVGVRLNSVT